MRIQANGTSLIGSRRPTIVVMAAVAWEEVFARNQHLARGLAQRGWDVVYVEPPVTWLSPLKNRAYLHKLRLRPRLATQPLDDAASLRVLTPPPILPFGQRDRRINRINQRRLAQCIRGAVDGPLLLYTYLPGSVDLLPHLRPQAVVYDCADDHAAFPGTHDPKLVRALEDDLVAASQHVFATSHGLWERLSALRPDVRLIPNAAEVDHFQTTEQALPHPLLAAIPEPRLGFIGGIGAWVDQDYIRGIAIRRPDLQLVLIGPALTDISRLRGHGNIHLLGPQPYSELPRFLRGFQATLFCFSRSPLTESVNPVKVYEYLAAGKEVIATPNRELAQLQDLVWLAADPDQAVAAMDRILVGERRCNGARREAFIHANSWSNRVDEVEKMLLVALDTHDADWKS
jgi:glycosyltransferase involved in cell wall biosynthesis